MFHDFSGALPAFRRLAAVLTGSTDTGDPIVENVLRIVCGSDCQPGEHNARLAFLSEFHRHWCDYGSYFRPHYVRDRNHRALLREEPGTRALLAYRFCEGLTDQDCADVTGLDRADVKQLASDALQRMSAITESALIIEDDPITAQQLQSIVCSLGFDRADLARSSTEAVEVAQTNLPGLVLTDINLRDGATGLNALKDIRSWWAAPAVIVTAFPDIAAELADGVPIVPKPFQTPNLEQAITNALSA